MSDQNPVIQKTMAELDRAIDEIDRQSRYPSDQNPVIQKTLMELDRAIDEIDRQLQHPPVSPMPYTEQTTILRTIRNMCSLYGADLLGDDLTEEQKLDLCRKIVRC